MFDSIMILIFLAAIFLFLSPYIILILAIIEMWRIIKKAYQKISTKL